MTVISLNFNFPLNMLTFWLGILHILSIIYLHNNPRSSEGGFPAPTCTFSRAETWGPTVSSLTPPHLFFKRGHVRLPSLILETGRRY